jgi:acetolactate synthase-1/2/3 large subunit
VLVLRDSELATIAQFQQVALERKASSELPHFNLEVICRGVDAEYLAMDRNEEAESLLRQALTVTDSGRPLVVEVTVDFSQKTYFTRGVVRVNLGRLPWPHRLRFVLWALGRRVRPHFS